jgi:hypothetical protein
MVATKSDSPYHACTIFVVPHYGTFMPRDTVIHELIYSMELSPSFRSRQFLNCSRNPKYFMGSDGSLQCSQEPSICPYPQPDESKSYHHIVFL